MKLRRIGVGITGLALGILLGSHQITGGMSKSYNKIGVVEVGEATVERFDEYLRKQPEKLHDFIDPSTLESIVNDVVSDISVPVLLTQDYFIAKGGVESEDDAYAISAMDARGVMQLRREAWEQVDSTDFDTHWYRPKDNIRAGIKYLIYVHNFLKDNVDGWSDLDYRKRLDYISAAYNAGPGTLQDAGWDISSLPSETLNHIRKMNIRLFNDSTYAYSGIADTSNIAMADSSR